MSKKEISSFIASQKLRFNRCLDPTFSCKNKAIRAHSVQNANALELIEEKNHVSEMKIRIKGGKPICSFQLVGRKSASTFTGLCGNHDAEIFRPIDTKPLSFKDEEQLFLVAYRSVTRELHAVMEGAMRIQGTYQQLVAEGKVSGTEASPAGIEATNHMLKAWGVWKYRHKYFDAALARKRFGGIKHTIFKIEHEPPTVAASSFFSVDLKPWGEPFAAVIMNVIPSGPTETTVIFSYPREHSGKAKKYIAPVMTKHGDKRKYELSYLIIDRAENFFVSPKTVKGWSTKKLEMIESSFVSSILSGKTKRAKELMLFETV